jgi:hypothetical protein
MRKTIGSTLLLLCSTVAFAECTRVKVDAFAKELAAAHKADSWSAFVTKYGDISQFTLFIQHAIPESVNREYEISHITGLSKLGAALNARRTEGVPFPDSRPLIRCDNNLCRYNFREGIQHNTLYLTEFRYRLENKCLLLESIWFMGGT